MKTQTLLALLLTLGFCTTSAHAKGRDIDGDKVLSLEEFLANRKHPDKARKHFEKADANDDGKLERSERAGLKKHGKHTAKRHRKNHA